MALVDVSELMLDPDFVQPLTLVRRTPTVDSYGENQLAEAPQSVVGSVQPIDGNTLHRLPDEFRVANVQMFFLKERIIDV